MKHALTTPTKTGTSAVRILSVVALAMTLGTVTISAAKADWHGAQWNHRGWNDHARDSERWRHDHPHYVPGYVVAPPVVYAPPPPSPGINLILPLNFH